MRQIQLMFEALVGRITAGAFLVDDDDDGLLGWAPWMKLRTKVVHRVERIPMGRPADWEDANFDGLVKRNR